MSKYPKIALFLALFSGATVYPMHWAYKGLSAGLTTVGFGAVVGYPTYKAVTDESTISWGKKVPHATQAFIHDELRKTGLDPKGVECRYALYDDRHEPGHMQAVGPDKVLLTLDSHKIPECQLDYLLKADKPKTDFWSSCKTALFGPQWHPKGAYSHLRKEENPQIAGRDLSRFLIQRTGYKLKYGLGLVDQAVDIIVPVGVFALCALAKKPFPAFGSFKFRQAMKLPGAVAKIGASALATDAAHHCLETQADATVENNSALLREGARYLRSQAHKSEVLLPEWVEDYCGINAHMPNLYKKQQLLHRAEALEERARLLEK